MKFLPNPIKMSFILEKSVTTFLYLGNSFNILKIMDSKASGWLSCFYAS